MEDDDDAADVAAVVFREIGGIFRCDVVSEVDGRMVNVAMLCADVFENFLERNGVNALELEGITELSMMEPKGNA